MAPVELKLPMCVCLTSPSSGQKRKGLRDAEVPKMLLKFPGGEASLSSSSVLCFPRCRMQSEVFIRDDEVLGLGWDGSCSSVWQGH